MPEPIRLCTNEDAPECCGNCKFQAEDECHRYPPTVLLPGDGFSPSSTIMAFPDVDAKEWCGEWASH